MDLQIPSIDELAILSQAFVEEIKEAMQENPQSSLSWLETAIHKSGNARSPFQVLVIGGSKLAHYIQHPGQEFSEELVTEAKVPTLQSTTDLVTLIQNNISEDISHIVINFAFPIQPTPRKDLPDGYFIHSSKEHSLEDLRGKLVGETLENELYRLTAKKYIISVVHDSISLAMAGTKESEHNWKQVFTTICGTGVNAGIFSSERSIINLESAAFNKFNIPEHTKKIDAYSQNKGLHLFEKSISGKYLPDMYNYYSNGSVTHAHEVSEKAQKGDILAQSVLKYSACLLASQVYALGLYTHVKHEADSILCIIEGSVFTKGWQYKETVSKILSELSSNSGFTVQIKHVPHSSILGAIEIGKMIF